ncbi:putative F420-0 ABC transporter substrate-binding protein [Actinotalea sp. Marseille-Q4924]|uniref:putative F420-0 ABC transporter substrate-binding protein n=1 Tax=Actinotalea sp. Marseille-Q4924 TaxID=2866571 RepID=UPI001CE46DDB|nr:putative F420-0 ABC transporter substrate-binding protein [Actinotalea sp. Marseille-Q4924]
MPTARSTALNVPRRRRRVAPAALAGATLLLAACGGTAASPGSEAPAPAAETSAAATATDDDAAFTPVELDNCGFATTVESPPERVVTIKSSTFELMLALGLADRVVGTAFLDGEVPERYADAAADVPVIADAAPGREAVLALEPDLVFAGWESNFSADGAGERSELEDVGVTTYVAPAACKAPGYMPDPLTFDSVFADIIEAGEILGVPKAAADLVAEQEAALAAIEPDDRGLRALWYSSGTDVPYVGAGIGAPQMIMSAAGLENVASDVEDTWTSFGWEQVADADPEVIVLVDAAWNTAEQKIALLEANPTASRLAAVRESRYVVVPFASTEAGVRNVDAVAQLVRDLAEIEVAP